MLDAASTWVGSRLAGSWANGKYPSFRDGASCPRDIALESDEGLREVLAFLEKEGPSLKTSDWAGSGWKGKGSRSSRKR